MRILSEDVLLEANALLLGSSFSTPSDVDPREIHAFVVGAEEANERRDPSMGFKSTLAWGISLGIIAERLRRGEEVDV